MRAQMRSIVRGALLVAALIALGLWIDARWRIEQWRIEADRTELAAAIEAWLAVHRAELDLWGGRPARLHRALRRALPQIASLEVRRELPHRLFVRATSRRALALVPEHSRLMLIDAEGVLWPARGDEDLPFLRAPKAQRKQGAMLLQVLQAWGWWQSTSEVRFDAMGWRVLFVAGERWLLPKQKAAQRAAELARWLQTPRWRAYRWRVDARDRKRWFLRPVGRREVS